MPKSLEIIRKLAKKRDNKLLLFVVDGIGGVPDPKTNKTELEFANIPNIDELARNSICGMILPVSEGITPGSGLAHLSLFGYDPFEYEIGRGVLEAIGLGVNLGPNDLACRANFATIDYDRNIIVDRRAGRQSTEETSKLCDLLSKQISSIDGTKVRILPGKGHRFVVIFSQERLSDKISENDPQKNNFPPREIHPISSEGNYTARVVNSFLKACCEVIRNNRPANYVLLRGFSKLPKIPSMNEIYNIRSAAIATYPMYKGLARIVGMDVLDSGPSISDELSVLRSRLDEYDFFYLHIKETDSYGEDGEFIKKVRKIEEVDRYIPEIREMGFDVIALTGDHSTPAVLKSHSWHPVPICLYTKFAWKNNVKHFCEKECINGILGKIAAKDVLPLMLANAERLDKYGA